MKLHDYLEMGNFFVSFIIKKLELDQYIYMKKIYLYEKNNFKKGKISHSAPPAGVQ